MFTDIGDLQQQLESIVASLPATAKPAEAIAEKTTGHTEEVDEPMVEDDGASEATQFEEGADHRAPPDEQDTLGELLDIDHIDTKAAPSEKQAFETDLPEEQAKAEAKAQAALINDRIADIVIKRQALENLPEGNLDECLQLLRQEGKLRHELAMKLMEADKSDKTSSHQGGQGHWYLHRP